MQQNIFEENKKPTASGLIIGKQQKKILSKQQETFNRLIKRIEKLRSELVNVSKSLDEKLDFYVKHIYPLEKQVAELNKESVRLLYDFFKSKKFLTKRQRHSLGAVISEKLEDIFDFEKEEPTEEFKQIFKAVQGISYDEALENDFDILKSDMESMFEDFGFDMKFDDLHGKMNEEDMIKKSIEFQEELKKQADQIGQRKDTRKKSKKQLEKEEKEKKAEEVRSKNISSIYKQLAKIFHPDLEQDEDLKLQKEELMKQLTNAYESKDLHTLLRLELIWIQKEENSTDKLTDEKLSIYNQVLNEQILELEHEMHEMFAHPRYQPLVSFTLFPQEIKSLNLKNEKRDVENYTKTLAASNSKLQGNEKQALAEVKQILRDYDSENLQDNDFSRFMR